MSKRWFRPRKGGNDDVIWEIKTRLLFFIPASWGWGFREYANAASHRNRIAVKMNRLSKEFMTVLEEYAEAEASLQAESNSLNDNRYNHLWVGDPILMSPKELKDMLPYVSEPEPEWRAFVNSAVWKRVLKSRGVHVKTDGDNRHPHSPQKAAGRIIISPSNAIKDHPEFFEKDGAVQLVKYQATDQSKKPESDKRDIKNDSENNRGSFRKLRSKYPQQKGESQDDWDERLKDIYGNE